MEKSAPIFQGQAVCAKCMYLGKLIGAYIINDESYLAVGLSIRLDTNRCHQCLPGILNKSLSKG